MEAKIASRSTKSAAGKFKTGDWYCVDFVIKEKIEVQP